MAFMGARSALVGRDAACATAGLPWEQALCSYRLAQSLLTTRGSRAEAAAALREAARIARLLGAAPILADVEALAIQGHLSLAEPDTRGPDARKPLALATWLWTLARPIVRAGFHGTELRLGHLLDSDEKPAQRHTATARRVGRAPRKMRTLSSTAHPQLTGSADHGSMTTDRDLAMLTGEAAPRIARLRARYRRRRARVVAGP